VDYTGKKAMMLHYHYISIILLLLVALAAGNIIEFENEEALTTTTHSNIRSGSGDAWDVGAAEDDASASLDVSDEDQEQEQRKTQIIACLSIRDCPFDYRCIENICALDRVVGGSSLNFVGIAGIDGFEGDLCFDSLDCASGLECIGDTCVYIVVGTGIGVFNRYNTRGGGRTRNRVFNTRGRVNNFVYDVYDYDFYDDPVLVSFAGFGGVGDFCVSSSDCAGGLGCKARTCVSVSTAVAVATGGIFGRARGRTVYSRGRTRNGVFTRGRTGGVSSRYYGVNRYYKEVPTGDGNV
jgi:hypothetical protein